MLFTFLWEKLFEKNFSRWKTANRCYKGCCKLQAPLKGVNFGAKLTHFNVFWLDISFFSYVKKKKKGIVRDSYWRYHFLHMWKPSFTHLIGWNSFVYENVWHSFLVSISQYVYDKINICYSLAGRSVLGETVPEVLSTALGTQTEGTVSPNTDRSRPVNNIFIFFLPRFRSFRKILLQPPTYVCWRRARSCWCYSKRAIDCKPKQNITTWFLTCNLYYHN